MSPIYYDDEGYPIPPQLTVEPKHEPNWAFIILCIMMAIAIGWLIYRLIIILNCACGAS